MASVQTPPATLDDLARVTDKAELIDGRIGLLMPTGRKPGRVAGRIYRSLDDDAMQSGQVIDGETLLRGWRVDVDWIFA
jgi:hypothetical protein